MKDEKEKDEVVIVDVCVFILSPLSILAFCFFINPCIINNHPDSKNQLFKPESAGLSHLFFYAGASGMMTGNYFTTTGRTLEEYLCLLECLGFLPRFKSS
jgi:hypothetical protein